LAPRKIPTANERIARGKRTKIGTIEASTVEKRKTNESKPQTNKYTTKNRN
jgi:hypothetical protein